MAIPTGNIPVRSTFRPFLGIMLCLFLFASLAMAGEVAANQELRIVRITPAGEDVPPGRQIVIQFDRQVVPLGRMERNSEELPITIEPQLNCQWRWLDGTTLACNLNQDDELRPATAYRLTVRPGIMAEDKTTLAEPVHHRFLTERPRVTESWFKIWLAPRLPQNALRFNLPVTRDSLTAHLSYRLTGGRRLPVKIEQDPDNESSDQSDHKVWLVSPATELPADTPGQLTVEPGILAVTGGAPGVEQRVLDTVHPIPEFRFLGVRCLDASSKPFVIAADGTPSAGQQKTPPRCLPSGGVALLFSSPVVAEEVKRGLQLTPPLAGISPDSDPWDQIYSSSRLFEPYRKKTTYSIDLPEAVLRPNTDYRLELAAGSVQDEFGRALTGAARAHFATDHRAPDFALLRNMPVLEKNLDSDAHLWAVNLSEIRLDYQALTTEGKTPGTRVIKPAGPEDATIPVPMEIRSLIGRESGLVQGSFATTPSVPGKTPEESWFFAQVTPFQVHLKLGHHNSLVWITDLATGSPVENVAVRVLQSTFKDIGNDAAALAEAKTDGEGIAILPGTITLDPRLRQLWANGRDEPNLFLHCAKEGDMAVLPMRYDYQVSAEGANREYIPDWLRPLHGHIRAWGTTAQGIYKAGDTVQYKLFVRDQDNQRFIPPPGAAGSTKASSPPRYRLRVFDPLDKVVYEQNDIALSSFGTCHGEFTLAKTGAVGWYRFLLSASYTDEQWEAMRVLVSDFTPAPFRVLTNLQGDSFAAGDTVSVATEAKLHAGGAYSGAAARVTASLEPRPFTPDNPRLQGFVFNSTESDNLRPPAAEAVGEAAGNLDGQGRLASVFPLADGPVWFGRLTVESSVQDDRGKSIASRAQAAYFGRDRYVGLLQQDWTLQANKAATVKLAVVDRQGRLIDGVPVTLTTEHKKTWGARVKSAGDAYVTEYQHVWEPEQTLTGISAAEPGEFTFTPAVAGSLRLVATITDSAGRPHTTVIERWVIGKGEVLWESTPGNLLNVFPERSTYNVGETARFLVQNPFPGCRALITVERFGIIDRWTTTFADSSAVVEIPVRPDYLPGFYVSVMVTAPRVEKPPGPQGEDLGKPTYRLGYVKIPVKDPYKELEIRVSPEKELYKPGDTVKVGLQVQAKHAGPGESLPPVELAVAVLDEAVFDLLLAGRKTFDPYQGFYFLDALDLSNYNLLMQLVGRERLAMKGASPGGGGGPDLSMRSLFKFVSYWNPALTPDAEGRAAIEFTVPDNLTGWKVLAMAVTPADLMGLGEGNFKVNQKTEIRPALPNQLLAGDSFSAGFTVMNRTDQPRTLKVACTARGPIEGGAGAEPVRFDRELTLAPYQRETLSFPLTTAAAGTITLAVTAGDATDRDGLTVSVPVGEPRPGEMVASYGTVADATASEPILVPKDLGKSGGELSLLLSPSVIGGLDGTFAFLRDYPYSCWEQKLSRGLMAALYGPLKPYLPQDFSWPDSEKTARETLALAAEFQAPNGGMAFYQAKDEYVSPYLSAYTALAFNRLRQEGYLPSDQVEQRLHGYLLNLLRHDAVPAEFSRGMTATVRAVALAALTERGRLPLAEVLRYQPQLPVMNLFGKAFYLRALVAAGGTPGQQREVLDALLAHADRSSGQVIFGESLDSGFQTLLSSPTRDNAAILGALLAWLKANPEDTAMRELAVNLMRTLTASRKAKNHWPSTQENIFMAAALADFAGLFEAKQPEMQVSGRLDRQQLGAGRFTAFTEPPLVFSRRLPAGEAGKKALLHLEKIGDGRLYYTARLAYSPAEEKPSAVNAGIEVHREYSVKRDGIWQLMTGGMEVRTGEVVKVDLYASLPAERYFVVLEDPVPGGLEPVNTELATASHADTASEPAPVAEGSHFHRFADWREDTFGRGSFYHRELRHDAVRFYSERLAAGRYHLSYTAQAIASGRFRILPAHAEEMYTPEVYGNSAPAGLRITAQ